MSIQVYGRLNRLVAEHFLERLHASGLAWSPAPPDLAPEPAEREGVAGGVRIPATVVRLRARPILDSRLGEAARPPAMEGADADVALTENAARDLLALTVYQR